MELDRQPLGSTGLTVTRLCFGTAALGDMPETFDYSVSEAQALQTLRAIFESPINFVDTAASYGDGESERRIGLVLRELGGVPEGVVLSTKADRSLQTGDFSGEQMHRSVERSLRLLGLDRLQLVFLHDPEHTSFSEALAPGGPVDVLRRLHEQGVIEHLGVAGGPIAMEMEYVATGLFEVVITHNRYTLLNQSAAPLLESAAQRGVAVVNAAPYGSGMLAKGPATYARYAYQDASADLVERARALAAICARFDVPLPAAAVQFSLREPRIASTIVGITRPERVQQTLDLASVAIPDELWTELQHVPVERADPEIDRWR